MFAIAYPYLAYTEVKAGTTPPWVSVPYVLLQEPELTVRRVRLPQGATALAILAPPQDKVIYIFGGKSSGSR